MDTFNFSFFEDKPEDSSPAPHSDALSGSSPPAPEDHDPFDFSGFDFVPNPAAPDQFDEDYHPLEEHRLNQIAPEPPLVSTAPPEEALLAPETPLGLEQEFAFGNEEEFPSLDLAPSIEADSAKTAPAEIAAIELAPVELAPVELALEPKSESLSVDALALDTLAVAPAEAVTDVPLPASAPPLAEPESAAPRKRYLTQDDPFGEVAPHRVRLRIAVLGASGIGFNHARWLNKHGGQIVGFLGSSEASLSATAQKLQDELGHEVPGFSDLEQLLTQTQPQAVCIASPPAMHFGQALTCLEAGAHVLCEKPLVYAAGRSKRENRDGARELLKTATKKNLVLATQLQYGAATPILCRLAGVTPYEVGDFAMELETSNPRASRDPKELWIDLGPHPLAVAQFLAGEQAQLIEETLQVSSNRTGTTAELSVRFGVRSEGGRVLMCRAIVRCFDRAGEAREPRRRFAFNGRVVQYNGVKLADGSYIAQYVSPDGYISHYPDPVDFLAGNFVRTCWGDDQLVLSPAQGVQNLEWLLTLADKIA